jgi:hypothetical protein
VAERQAAIIVGRIKAVRNVFYSRDTENETGTLS